MKTIIAQCPESEDEELELSKKIDECTRYHDLEHLTLPKLLFSDLLFEKLITCIENSPHLNHVDFSDLNLNCGAIEKIMSALSSCSELKTLIMKNCNFPFDSSKSILSFLKQSTSLEKLDIRASYPTPLSDKDKAAFEYVILSSHSLQEVITRNRMELSRHVVEHLENNNPKARSRMKP